MATGASRPTRPRACSAPPRPAPGGWLRRGDGRAQPLRQGGAAARPRGMQPSWRGDAPRAGATRPAVTEAPRPTFEARPAGGRESMPPRAPAVPVERSATAERPAPAVTPPEPSSELGVAWQRVVDEINKKKPMLGGMLAQVVPGGVSNGTLTIVLSGTGFHRDMLTDAANKDLLTRLVRRHAAGAERVDIAMRSDSAAGPSAHPADKAAKDIFQGEVVAVRPRLPEGEGQ